MYFYELITGIFNKPHKRGSPDPSVDRTIMTTYTIDARWHFFQLFEIRTDVICWRKSAIH